MNIVVLDDIAEKVAEGLPLTDADAEALASTYDIVSLGMIADDVRRVRHGTRTTFLRVAHSPRDTGDDSGGLVPPSDREVRIGVAFAGIDAARVVVRRASAAAGAFGVSGFSLADIEQAADGDLARVREWVDDLREAGLHLIDQAPIDRLQHPAAVLQAAEAGGLPVARITVHGGVAGGSLVLIRRVAALQAETNGVRAFAPIARHPGAEPTTGYEDVKAVALARILLGTVPHIQADWTLHGPKLAQVALTFGADDMDNVSPLDEVAEGRRRAPLEEIRRNIRAAGFEAVERDSRFTIVG